MLWLLATQVFVVTSLKGIAYRLGLIWRVI
jgi:hypothetical protein